MRIRFAGAHGGFVAERLFVEMEYSSNCAEHWHLQEMSARLFDMIVREADEIAQMHHDLEDSIKIGRAHV